MPLETLAPVVLVLSALVADEGAFVRAIEAVAGERYVEMTKALDAVRAGRDADPEPELLEEDCVQLSRLAPVDARALLVRVRTVDVSPPVAEAIRELLVRTLARTALAHGAAADPVAARRAAAAAVELAARTGDPADVDWARRRRVEALLAAGPHPDDGAVLAADLATLRAATREDGAAAARRERLDRQEALLAHRQGDDGRALLLLEPIDAAESGAPDALLRLRLVVATRRGRHDLAARDAARLEALVEATDAPAARTRGWFALATWHRLRPADADEDARAPARRAAALYERAAEEASTLVDRAAATEGRGSVLSYLREYDAARADFEHAATLYAEAGRDLLACRQQMRLAWNAFSAGETTESRRALERFDDALATVSLHATGRLGEERNAHHLRARVALADDDLEAATAALAALFAADRRLTRPLGRKDILLSNDRRAAICGSLVGDLLAVSERRPDARRRAFELAVACAEHARVLLLATLIAGPERPTFGLAPGSLPPLPEGVAELRWTRTAPSGDTDARYVLIARHGDQVELRALESVTDLDRDVDAFLSRWMSPASLGDAPAAYGAAAYALFGRLFGPAGRWFDGDAAPRRLVVLADGVLERLPLGALVTQDVPTAASFSTLRYLVRSTAVVHAPSLGVLAALDPPNAHRDAVAVIDPIARAADGAPLPSLRSTQDERAALATGRELVVLRRASATLPALRRALASRDVGWLHLASHAVPDPTMDDRAALLLTTNAQTRETLGVRAVVALPLTPGTRVVLSACATASGVVRPGEGVQALWRAFLVARAACVLSTLRAVDDRSAGHWIGEFHAAAADGLPLAEAARRASVRWVTGASRPTFPRGHAVRDHAHPYLWAAWTVVGNDGGPLPLPGQ